MPVPYTKPHLRYEDQLKLLRGRGLEIGDEAAALRLLQAVGYYRLSAYVYPFRELLPPDRQAVATPAHYRSETIVPGTTFAQIASLWRFDRLLRLLVLDAVETVEVGLRTKIAYVLGERDPFGHLRVASLDAAACNQAHSRVRAVGETRHQVWLRNYQRSVRDASREDFVRHNLHKYDELPVWIAVELLTFGALVRLFNLMRPEDRTVIARELGIKGGGLAGSWLEAINYLRNVAAHHARLWNRSMTYKVRRFNRHQVGSGLAHLAGTVPTDKVYSSLAITAYLLGSLGSDSNWPGSVLDHVRQFPLAPGLSPIESMGFPAAWDGQPLWAAVGRPV
ncbi:Abi family protein [Kribbella solani]|uniref:Abortive infection bacteriophage resistance protein n=1 Tax=Kribbella solani TaxID=236067 RepID=A0A841DUV5_9ACTN|nr:abortive infection bacteriophage resistance protein [Kribbella solani]